MPVHRVIYRLDFEPVFDIIDSAGKILRLLKEAGKGEHWPDLGEIPDRHSVSGRNSSKKEGWWTSISLEPTALIGEFETLDGLHVEQIEKSKFIARLFSMTNMFRKEFRINTFKRIGFRIILFEKAATDRESVKNAFQSLLDKNFSDNLVKTLGGYTDIGIALDGQHDDGLFYKLKCGPYGEREFKNYLPNLQRIADAEKMEDKADHLALTMDIDMYEKNTHLSDTMHFKKWCYPVLAKNTKVIDTVSQAIMKGFGEIQ